MAGNAARAAAAAAAIESDLTLPAVRHVNRHVQLARAVGCCRRKASGCSAKKNSSGNASVRSRFSRNAMKSSRDVVAFRCTFDSFSVRTSEPYAASAGDVG